MGLFGLFFVYKAIQKVQADQAVARNLDRIATVMESKNSELSRKAAAYEVALRLAGVNEVKIFEKQRVVSPNIIENPNRKRVK